VQATVEAKEGLMESMNQLVEKMNKLSQDSQALPQTVPLDVVEYIENGRNPDVYTREFVELLAKQNHYINGKMKAISSMTHAVSFPCVNSLAG
jgi:mediator of RNA polymerase II transcription subunit 10